MKLFTLLVVIITGCLPMLCYANSLTKVSAANQKINAAYLSLQQEKLPIIKVTLKLTAAIESCVIKYSSLSECLAGSKGIPSDVIDIDQEITSIKWLVGTALRGRIFVNTNEQGIYHGKNYELIGEKDDVNNIQWVEGCQSNNVCFAHRLKQIQQQKIQQVSQIIPTDNSPSEVAGLYLTAALSSNDFNRVVTLSTLQAALKLSLKHKNEVIKPIRQFQHTVLDESLKKVKDKFNNETKKVANLQIRISGIFNDEFFEATKTMKLMNFQGYWLVSSFR